MGLEGFWVYYFPATALFGKNENINHRLLLIAYEIPSSSPSGRGLGGP